ncbi:MAG: VIT1/CCC1 transporter family protein [Desulfobaccales bacterium]|jgi:VIT1/CCC1 family predicted Fe2+/Mn2+ transporter
MKEQGNLSLLHEFWQSEIVADRLYSFLAARCHDAGRRDVIAKIGRMEQGHATIWNRIAAKSHGASFDVTLSLRWKILLGKLLSIILPFTIFIHYMEHSERNSILEYSKLFEAYSHDEKTTTIIANIIRQEIGHEWQLMGQIADKESYIAKAGGAMDAMTVGIIETLGLVIGLLAAHASTLTIALTGLIATIGGLIAVMSISYITSKANYDLHEGRNRELKVKQEIDPDVLKRELEMALIGKGIQNETVKDILGIIGDDTSILSYLVKSVTMAGEAGEPKEAIKTTGLFFLIGAVPTLIPFCIGVIWDLKPLLPAIMAFALAVLTISTAGFFVAVLSGKKISVKIAHNIAVIMGTCAVTYGVGLAARILFGIGVVH